MKKKLISKITMLALVMCILPINIVHAATATVNEEVTTTVNEEAIKQVLTGYFSNILEEQKQLIYIDNSYIKDNTILKEYDELNSELSYKWFDGIGVRIEDYNVDVKINDIKYEDGLLKVNVENKANFKYINTDFNSSYNEKHIIYLDEVEKDKFLVERDIFDPDQESVKDILTEEKYNDYMKAKLSLMKIKENNLEEDVKKEVEQNNQNNNVQIKTNPLSNISAKSFSYNATAAANWAYNNAYSSPKYDEDCTNFVSKALRAGGVPTDGTWYQDSNAWIRVIELRSWLLNKGYATQYNNDYSYARVGDVIQYYNYYKQEWRHSVFVTARDNWSSYPYVCAHSNAARNVLASQYYPNGANYSGFRVLHIVK